MRKATTTLAFAAALILPAVGATTVTAPFAHAANGQFERVKPRIFPKMKASPKKGLLRICLVSQHAMFIGGRARLHQLGWRYVQQKSYHQNPSSCTQRMILIACKSGNKFRHTLEYMNGRRTLLINATYVGKCIVYSPYHRRKRGS